MFSTDTLHRDGFELVVLKDTDNGVQVEIIPAHSAMLHAFRIPYGTSQLNIIDNYANPDDYRKNMSTYFKGAKLSPFACRIPGGVYEWEGKQYRIQKTITPGNCIHGLLYDVAFMVEGIHADERSATVTLHYRYDGVDEGYPFPYNCEVEYKLQPDAYLQITTTVSNLAGATIPIMDGWHPYFTTGTPIDEMELQLASEQIVEFNAQLVPSGRILPYNRFLELTPLEGISLDNSFLLNFSQHASTCILRDPRKHVAITFYPDNTYPVLQIYIPSHRNSIAIENLSGAPNAFNNGIGLFPLPAGESRVFRTAVSAVSW